jgi:hypothetical protein
VEQRVRRAANEIESEKKIIPYTPGSLIETTPNMPLGVYGPPPPF